MYCNVSQYTKKLLKKIFWYLYTYKIFNHFNSINNKTFYVIFNNKIFYFNI